MFKLDDDSSIRLENAACIALDSKAHSFVAAGARGIAHGINTKPAKHSACRGPRPEVKLVIRPREIAHLPWIMTQVSDGNLSCIND